VVVVLTSDRFGFSGAGSLDDEFESDLAVDRSGEDVGLAMESIAESASVAPALPGVVEVIAPPLDSTFISPVDPPDSPEAPEAPASFPDPSPAVSPTSDVDGCDEPPGVDPAAAPCPAAPADDPPGSAEPDEDSAEESEESGSAHTTPGVLATATPTPKATAKAPTRPTYDA
jgi:hypothetical protein